MHLLWGKTMWMYEKISDLDWSKFKWLQVVQIGPTTNQQVAERFQHFVIFSHNLDEVDIVAWNFSFSIPKEMPTFLFSLKATRLVYLVEELPCRNNRAVGHAVTFDISIVVMTNIRRKTKENVPALILFLFFMYIWQKCTPKAHISWIFWYIWNNMHYRT